MIYFSVVGRTISICNLQSWLCLIHGSGANVNCLARASINMTFQVCFDPSLIGFCSLTPILNRFLKCLPYDVCCCNSMYFSGLLSLYYVRPMMIPVPANRNDITNTHNMYRQLFANGAYNVYVADMNKLVRRLETKRAF